MYKFVVPQRSYFFTAQLTHDGSNAISSDKNVSSDLFDVASTVIKNRNS